MLDGVSPVPRARRAVHAGFAVACGLGPFLVYAGMTYEVRRVPLRLWATSVWLPEARDLLPSPVLVLAYVALAFAAACRVELWRARRRGPPEAILAWMAWALCAAALLVGAIANLAAQEALRRVTMMMGGRTRPISLLLRAAAASAPPLLLAACLILSLGRPVGRLFAAGGWMLEAAFIALAGNAAAITFCLAMVVPSTLEYPLGW